MRGNKALVLMIIFVLGLSTLIYAAGAGVTSMNFIKIAQGGRQAGMGEAFTGLADDVNAIYWNPAGLAELTRHQFCLMHSAWLLDINSEYIAYAIPVAGFGTLAAYGNFLNAGEILQITEDASGNYVPPTGDKVGASNMSVSVAYGKKLSEIFGENTIFEDFYAGLNLNILTEQVFEDSGGGFGINIGGLYYPRYENFSVGLVLQNIGIATNRPDLPSVVKFGLGYRFALEDIMLPFREEGYFMRLENNTAADIDVIYYPVENLARVNVGAEKFWRLNKYHSVAARMGYKFGTDLGVVSGFTFGLGYELTANKDTSFNLDYALVPYGDLGISHRISLTGKMFGPAENHFYEDKADSIVHYRKGFEALYARRYSEALFEFAESIKRDRKYALSYVGVGACFLNMGKKELALKAYNKALELDPNNTKLRNFVDSYKWGSMGLPQVQEIQQTPPQQQNQTAPESPSAPVLPK
jgi:tetratricopeptide (TPR) repeat protein